MRSMRRMFLVAVLAGFAGCASQVTRAPEDAAAPEPVRALASFELVLSDAAKAQLGDSVKFDIEALRGTLKRTLDASNLIAGDGEFKMTVTVDEVRVRSTFNAIMWGFMAGTDQLNGTAKVFKVDGQPVGSFKIATSYGLGGFGGGQDSARLTWLYEEFSKMLTQELVARRDRPR